MEFAVPNAAPSPSKHQSSNASRNNGDGEQVPQDTSPTGANISSCVKADNIIPAAYVGDATVVLTDGTNNITNDTTPGDGRNAESGGSGGSGDDAGMWEEYEYEEASTGRHGVYYYNHSTGVSQYEEPACLTGLPHQLYHPPDGPAWHAYVDDAGFVYYYNHTTGCSQYEEPTEDYIPLRYGYAPDKDGVGAKLTNGASNEGGAATTTARSMGNGRTSGKKKKRKKRKRRRQSDRSQQAVRVRTSSVDACGEEAKLQPRQLHTTQVKQTAEQASVRVDVGSGDEHGGGSPLLTVDLKAPGVLSNALGSPSTSDSSDSGFESDSKDPPWVPGLGKAPPPSRVFKAFRWQSVCHATACESPALLFECLIRGLMYLLGAVAVAALAMCADKRRRRARLRLSAVWLREALIFVFSIPSFIVPCVLPLSVYKGLDSSGDDWSLQPLWTLIGDVDPRRFIIIRQGIGSHADNCSNINWQPSEYGMDNVWGRHLATPPGHTRLKSHTSGESQHGGGGTSTVFSDGDDDDDSDMGLHVHSSGEEEDGGQGVGVGGGLRASASGRMGRTSARAQAAGQGLTPINVGGQSFMSVGSAVKLGFDEDDSSAV